MPGPIKMRAIRDRLLGMPQKIGPTAQKHGPVAPSTPRELGELWGMDDDTWRLEADKLFTKTKKDGNEHLKIFNNTTKEYTGTKNAVTFKVPNHRYHSLHTHPNWDSPLSPGDFVSTLVSPNEKCSGATTQRAIYIIRKTPKTRGFTFQVDADKFKKEFAFEQARITKEALRKCKPREYPDMTDVVLETGKTMAKKYGLEYKVIVRKP
jgi:hypothetical protein